jgi:hypothetical protein
MRLGCNTGGRQLIAEPLDRTEASLWFLKSLVAESEFGSRNPLAARRWSRRGILVRCCRRRPLHRSRRCLQVAWHFRAGAGGSGRGGVAPPEAIARSWFAACRRPLVVHHPALSLGGGARSSRGIVGAGCLQERRSRSRSGRLGLQPGAEAASHWVVLCTKAAPSGVVAESGLTSACSLPPAASGPRALRAGGHPSFGLA